MDKYAQAFNAGYNNRINEFRKYAQTPAEILGVTDKDALTLPENEYVNATNTAAALIRAQDLDRQTWWDSSRSGLPRAMWDTSRALLDEGRKHPDYRALNPHVHGYMSMATNHLGQTAFRNESGTGARHRYVYPLSTLTNKNVQAGIPGYTNAVHNIQKQQQVLRDRLPPPNPAPRLSWRERLFGRS